MAPPPGSKGPIPHGVGDLVEARGGLLGEVHVVEARRDVVEWTATSTIFDVHSDHSVLLSRA